MEINRNDNLDNVLTSEKFSDEFQTHTHFIMEMKNVIVVISVYKYRKID